MKYKVIIWAVTETEEEEEPFDVRATVEADSGMLAVKKVIGDIEMVREIENQEGK